MRIGEIASRAGVNVQTLRYYERRGIIQEPQRTASRYRTYSVETVRIVRFIKHAQGLGFTLAEIEELLSFREDQTKKSEVRKRAEEKVRDIEARIERLRAMRDALQVLVESCKCQGVPQCPILEALDSSAGVLEIHYPRS